MMSIAVLGDGDIRQRIIATLLRDYYDWMKSQP